MDQQLTHIDEKGEVRMVDVSAKPDTYTIIDTLSSEHYAVGFLKGNDAIAQKVTETLKQLNEDGTVQELCDKYAEYGISYENWLIK